jgi:uncharacterized protein YceH (UPF0502 family)
MTTAQANPGVTFEAAQQGYRSNAEARRQARRDLQDALERKADRERAYRKRLSTEFAHQRDKGCSVVEAEVHAKGAAADIAWRRDMADAVAKAAAHRIAELEGERASLRQLVEWTREESQ